MRLLFEFVDATSSSSSSLFPQQFPGKVKGELKGVIRKIIMMILVMVLWMALLVVVHDDDDANCNSTLSSRNNLSTSTSTLASMPERKSIFLFYTRIIM